MKVLISAASYATSISGIQRHALNVTRCLLLLPEISELHLALAPWQCDLAQSAGLPSDPRLRTHISAMKRDSFSRNLWYWRRLPQLAAQLQADLVHLTYPVPLNSQAFNCPTVVTLHDLYPYEIPENFGFPKFIFNRAVLHQCLRAVDAIACVSEATRLRLGQYASPAVCRKARTVHNCVESCTDFEPAAPGLSPIPGWKNEPFLLCVAQHRRNKNICGLIRAFDRLIGSGWIHDGMKLVVIGTGGPETPAILRLVRDKGLNSRVHFFEGLSEAQLQWCYRQCEVLVAPSLTEGFDLPVAEGLLAGCRIVCSSIPAHREIAGDDCKFVPSRESFVEDLAAAIADILDEPKPQPIALPSFSAPVLASKYLALYNRLIESVAPQPSRNAAASIAAANPEAIELPTPDPESALVYRGR
ncbi:MAG: glycosyltransferase family 4 protein [Terracidiphilus sp.]